MKGYLLLKKSALLWPLVEKGLTLKSKGGGALRIAVALSEDEDNIKAAMGLSDEFTMLEYIAAVKALDSVFDAIESLQCAKDEDIKARAITVLTSLLTDELTA